MAVERFCCNLMKVVTVQPSFRHGRSHIEMIAQIALSEQVPAVNLHSHFPMAESLQKMRGVFKEGIVC